MAGQKFTDGKDPDEVLDFTDNWTDPLNGDTIVTSTFPDFDGSNDLADPDNPVPPLHLISSAFDDKHVTMWFSGGFEGATYSFTNRITTAGGRTMDRTLKLQVKTK